jgi:hypothetical protein
MNSFSEDENFFSLIRKIIKNEEELESAVLSVDKKKRLEKQRAELHEQYMMFIIELDRVRIRETPYHKFLLDFLRKDLGYGPLKIKDYWHDWNQEILECHQDTELIDRGGFVNRYFQLIPPYVKSGTIIPEGIKNIYHESRWCFVYGQYSATVAMCRTIIETVLKTKFHLEGKLDEIINTAKERGLIDGSIRWNANHVRLLANKILHCAKPVSEKDAKDAIRYVMVFLEKIYL